MAVENFKLKKAVKDLTKEGAVKIEGASNNKIVTIH